MQERERSRASLSGHPRWNSYLTPLLVGQPLLRRTLALQTQGPPRQCTAVQ